MSRYGPYAPHVQTGVMFSPAGFLLVAIAVLVAAIATVFWLTTGVSGFLLGDGWPGLRLAELLEALASLPSNLGDPAAAWPARIARGLPGAVGFYACLALIAATGAGALAGLRRLRALPGPLARRRRAPSARWAARRELRHLFVEGPRPGRIILGRSGRSLVAAEERQSVLVVAPPQSGKTTGLAIPALLEWPGPVIATSIKSDLLRDTLARRQQLGDALVFDPTGSTGLPTAAWTPLGSCGSWRGAQRMASWLCSVSRSHDGRTGIEDADFWFKSAAKLLAPYLLAASTGGYEIADVVRWVETQERKEVRGALHDAGEVAALRAAEATFSREERQRSSIYTTAETVLEAYGDPKVLESSRTPEIGAARLLDGGAHTLYLCGPAHEQARLAPVFAALMEEVISVAYESATATGKPLDPALLIVGDELANVAPIRSLPTIASTGAGQGILLISVFQDLAQLRTRWGESWRTIASSHRAKVIGTGLGDPESLDYVRRLTGESEFRQRSETAGYQGHHSKTESTAYRSLAPANVVREAAPGTAVLVYGNLPAARLRLRLWFEDRTLRGLADGGRSEPAPAAPRGTST